MDFGSILDAWDVQQSEQAKKEKAKKASQQVSRKKPNAPTQEEKLAAAERKTFEQIMEEDSKKRINPMELWLRRYGTVDKDAEAAEFAEKSKMENREYLRTMAPEARIDLHGLTRDEAWTRLEGFVADSIRRGLKKILIVHGKGNHTHGSDPVLGPMVRTFIEQNKNLGTSGHPDRALGGTGATWVIIK
ncbi:MAG: Smr/MutS family protein [Treponema sp.]|nr:Smr/MutS family protein [Treponema sp.]MBR4629124.1 Smr/MutS family protein [Treponema sp.]MBR6913859.1 Smr/MutS family protein [Treponema sp.]